MEYTTNFAAGLYVLHTKWVDLHSNWQRFRGI